MQVGKSGSRRGGNMSIRDKVSYGVSRFSGLGMSRTQSLGAIGSLMGESGRSLNTGAHNPNDPNGGSFGIGQWHSERRQALSDFAKSKGKAITDYKTQVDFIAHELKTTEKRTLERMKQASTLEQATKTWTNAYERPAAKYAHHNKRAQNASFAMNVVDGVNIAKEVDPGSLTGATNVSAGQSFAENPFGAIGDMLAGKTTLGDALNVPQGLETVGDMAKNALGLVQGKNVMTNAGGLLGALPGAQDPNNPLSAISGFLSNVTPASKLGAIAGGIIGGPQGSLIGGLIGQGLGMMLGTIGQPAAANQNMFGVGSSLGLNDYPDAPTYTDQERSMGWGDVGRDPRSSDAYRDSKQARDAIDSGRGGLW